jgi:hypothetical protein
MHEIEQIQILLIPRATASAPPRLSQRRRAFGPIALRIEIIIAEHQPEELERQSVMTYDARLRQRKILVVVWPRVGVRARGSYPSRKGAPPAKHGHLDGRRRSHPF